MDNAHRRSVLQQEITDILARRTASSAYLTTPDQAHSVVTRSLVCGSMALLALNPAPAYAVGLGEIRLSSALGEPLQATVPVQLGKDEQLASGCIGLAPRSTGDLTELRNTRLQIDPASGPGVFQLRISTTGSLPEPMYALNLRVDCPGLPVVQRQYVVMLDLPGLSLPAATAARALPARHKPASTSRHSVVSQPRPATSVSPLQHSTDPIPAGSTYRVREGDTLSTIAARIQGRPANFTWPLAGLIFRTNPRAFVRGNPDLIKLGWVIQIPEPAEWATLTPVQGPARLTTVTPPVHTGQPAEPVPVVPPVQIPATLAQPKPASTETQPAQPDTETVQALPAVKPQAIAETDSPFADEHAGSGQMADASTVEADATPATAIANTDSIAADIDTSDATTETEKPSVDTADPAAQAQIVAAAERPVTTTVNPLLGVLFGILIGLGLSALLLRGRLIDGALALLRSRRRETNLNDRAVPTEEQNFDETGDWLPTGAIEAAAIPVGQPAEQTYVVEVSDDTSVNDPFNPDAVDTATETAEEVAAPQAVDNADIDEDSSETVLSELFDEGLAALPAETDLPEEVFMTDEDDDSPTALAPTAELPHFNDSIPGADDVTAELEGLDQEDIETSELDLTSLSQTADDTKLSSTLKEALSLLEQDYQDEMTASQIIDQEAISKALDGNNSNAPGQQDD